MPGHQKYKSNRHLLGIKKFGLDVTIYDPWVNLDEVERVYGLSIDNDSTALNYNYSTIILAVGHDEFKKLDLESLKKQNCIVYDIKGFYDLDKVDRVINLFFGISKY